MTIQGRDGRLRAFAPCLTTRFRVFREQHDKNTENTEKTENIQKNRPRPSGIYMADSLEIRAASMKQQRNILGLYSIVIEKFFLHGSIMMCG